MIFNCHLLPSTVVTALDHSARHGMYVVAYSEPNGNNKVALIDLKSRSIDVIVHNLANPVHSVRILSNRSIVALGEAIIVLTLDSKTKSYRLVNSVNVAQKEDNERYYLSCDVMGNRYWYVANRVTRGTRSGSFVVGVFLTAAGDNLHIETEVAPELMAARFAPQLFTTSADTSTLFIVDPVRDGSYVNSYRLFRHQIVHVSAALSQKKICCVASRNDDTVAVLYTDGEISTYTFALSRTHSFKTHRSHFTAVMSTSDRKLLIGETLGFGGGRLSLYSNGGVELVAFDEPRLRSIEGVFLDGSGHIAIARGNGGIVAYDV